MGLVVSTGPPPDVTVDTATTDKKKTATEVICKEKNTDLARSVGLPCVSFSLATA